jgi:uncharacterized protein (TIGR00730 family)
VRRVCVFCGSNSGLRPEYLRAARETGIALVERGLGLVYGGANIGLMGEIANAVLAAGGEVIGVIPESLVAREIVHSRLTEIRVVKSMHERKMLMSDLADAFIALPGGYGTLDEFFEIVTWTQLGLHGKPCAVLNVCGYYDPLLNFLNQAVEEKFLRQQNRDLVLAAEDPRNLLDKFENYQPVQTTKWIGKSET